MTKGISVTGAATLSNSFMGNMVQVCAVTRDFRRTVDGFVKLGLGPWAVYTFGPGTVTEQTYRGRPAVFSMRLGLATSGNMLWEVIEPLEGPSIYKDFLLAHGEGIQHVAMGCEGLSFKERVAEFEARGCTMIQSGLWVNRVPFAYFQTEDLTTTTLEVFDFPAGFALPEPEEWIPGPPPK